MEIVGLGTRKITRFREKRTRRTRLLEKEFGQEKRKLTQPIQPIQSIQQLELNVPILWKTTIKASVPITGSVVV